jgi:Short-chain dehydrogenases of various substrate specificities
MMTTRRSNKPQPEKTGPPRGIAVITGAGSGIGRAIVLELAKSGVACCLVGRTLSKLEEVARLTARAGVKSIPMVADLGDLGAVAALAQRICSSRRRIDCLVHSAAAMTVSPGGGFDCGGIQQADDGERPCRLCTHKATAP